MKKWSGCIFPSEWASAGPVHLQPPVSFCFPFGGGTLVPGCRWDRCWGGWRLTAEAEGRLPPWLSSWEGQGEQSLQGNQRGWLLLWGRTPLSLQEPLESPAQVPWQVCNLKSLVCVWVAQSCPTLYNPMDCVQAPLSMGFSRQEHWSGLPKSLVQDAFSGGWPGVWGPSDPAGKSLPPPCLLFLQEKVDQAVF